MDTLTAIKYLYNNDRYGNEWQGAGMWEAVCQVLKRPKKKWVKSELNQLLDDAENR